MNWRVAPKFDEDAHVNGGASKIFASLREIGCEHVAMTVKSDNEPAMRALRRLASCAQQMGARGSASK